MSARPGPRLEWSLAAAALIAAGGAGYWALAFVGGGAALGVLLAAAAELLLLRRVRVQVSRDELRAVTLGEPEELLARITHDAAAVIEVRLRTRWPAELGGGSSTAAGVCGAGQTLTLAHQVIGLRRGEAHIEPPHLAITRFGLMERIVQEGTPQTVRVIPNLREVHRVHAQLNGLFLRGLGSRLSPRVGQGREFDRLREYVPGDDYGQISWKATARQRKPIVRQFRLERSQDVLFCVDRGHRMAARVGQLTRADHAVNAAVLGAYVCNRAEDRTGLLSFSSSVESGIAQGRGAAHLAAVTRFATGISPEYLPTDYRALAAHLERRLRTRTLVILFTALPERGDHGDLLAAMRQLMPRHLPMVLALKDVDLEAASRALPGDHRGLCRTLVASELVQDRALVIAGLRRMGVVVAEAAPEDTGTSVINAWVEVKRRQLL